MATKIVTKNSSTASAVPTASDLVQGELAVNVADKRLFTEDNTGTIVELGTNPSTLAVDTNTLYVDSTNNRVGIGTTSPSVPLQVKSSGELARLETTSSGGNNYLAFYKPSDARQGFIGFGGGSTDNKLYINNDENAEIVFRPNNTERMRIDSSGNVGIGTTSADEPLEVSGDVKSSGGNFGIYHFGDTSDVTKIVGRDASHGSFPNTMDFFTNSTQRMRIDSSGQVGIGTTNPSANLHVRNPTNGTEADAHFKISGAVSTYTAHHWLDGTAYYIGQNSSARRVRIYSGAETAGVNLNAGATSWGTFSDERLKYDVEPVENAVESLSNLRTVKYRLKDVDSAEDKKKIGLMAQDLVGVLDEVIDPLKRTGDDTEYMSVRYTELVPVLVKAIQEQQTLIESLTDRIAALEE